MRRPPPGPAPTAPAGNLNACLAAPEGAGAGLVGGDAVEHEPGYSLTPGRLLDRDYFVQRGGVGLEFGGVGEQVLASPGLLASALA